MSSHRSSPSSRFHLEPEAAVETMASLPPGRTLIVDFDLTLFTRNSTIEYLASARPVIAARTIVKLVEVLGLGAGGPGVRRRDRWRVRAVTVLLPWTLWRWRRTAGRLGIAGANPRVRRLIDQHDHVVIASLGFDALIEPLLEGMGLAEMPRVAMSLTGRRLEDKRSLLEARLGPEVVAESVVLTDSLDDEHLLTACAVPLLVEWPESVPRPLFGPD